MEWDNFFMMSVMSSAPSPTFLEFRRTYTHLSNIFYEFFELFGGSRLSQRGTILHLELYFSHIFTWGHTRGVIHYPLDQP